MDIKEKILNKFGEVTVEVEGFFTERFLNLCKFRNIKVGNIKNITNGIIRFDINIDEFKKLKDISKKTKCKIKVKNKKGIYFKMFKYRKRKYILYLFFLLIAIIILSNSFIWNVNTNIEVTEEINLKFNEIGIKQGILKFGLDENDLVKKLRAEFVDYSWIGVNIDGGNLNIEFVEKTVLDENSIQNTSIGDIYADKSGVISKIIPEKGTALYKEGSYIEEGTKIIEGKIYSEYLGEIDTTAKGIIRIESEYVFEKEYNYIQLEKEYSSNKKYNIGFSIDLDEFYINYLNNEEKYDKIKEDISFSLFGKLISLDLYTYNIYEEIDVTYSYEEINSIYEEEENIFIENVLSCLNDAYVVNEYEDIVKTDNGIKVIKKYTIDEEIGVFYER